MLIKKQGNSYVTAHSIDGINFHVFNENDPFEIVLNDTTIALFATRTNTSAANLDVCYEYVDVLSLNGVKIKDFEESLQDAIGNIVKYVTDDIPKAATEDSVLSPVPHGYSVSVVSSNPDVVAVGETGISVMRSDLTKTADLTVTVTEGTRSESKVVTVVVPRVGVESASPVRALVAGYPANVTASVSGTGLSGLEAVLFGKVAVVVNGAAKLSFSPSELPAAGSYTIDITENGVVVAQSRINVVVEPADLWKPAVDIGENGFSVIFGAPISFNEAKKGVRIESVPVDGGLVAYEGAVLAVAKEVLAGQKIEISGVKYSELFPSYNFTFVVTA